MVTYQDRLVQLRRKYKGRIPPTEIRKLKTEYRQTTPSQTPTPSAPPRPTPQQKQSEARARHTYEQPTPPTARPLNESQVASNRRLILKQRKELSRQPADAKFQYEGKEITKKQASTILGESIVSLNKYEKARAEMKRLHFNPDTGEPIWDDIPLKDRKYYPGAKEYFANFNRDQQLALIPGGKSKIIKLGNIWISSQSLNPVDRLKGIYDLFTDEDVPGNFVNRVAQKIHLYPDYGDNKNQSYQEICNAIQDILWDSEIEIQPQDKFYSSLHPAQRAVHSFFQATRQTAVGVITFPIAVAEYAGFQVPHISPAKKKYEQWEQRQSMGPSGQISTTITGFGTPFGLTKKEDYDYMQEQQKKYPLETWFATGGEVAGIWLGGKATKFAYKAVKYPASKLYLSKKLPYIHKVPKGFEKGFEIPLKKTKYLYGEGPSGITTKEGTWTVTKAGKIKIFKGRGKKILLSQKDVAKFEKQFKGAKRFRPAKHKTFEWQTRADIGQEVSKFKVKQFQDVEVYYKPRRTLLGKKIVKTKDAFSRAETEFYTSKYAGKTLPPSRQLLAPKQQVPYVKVSTKPVGGIKRFVLEHTDDIPLKEGQIPFKEGTLAYRDFIKQQRMKQGYTYIKPSKVKPIKGPLTLEEAVFGPEGKYVAYEPRVGFIMKEPKITKLAKGVGEGKPFVSPEMALKRMKPSKFMPKKLYKATEAEMRIGFKPEISRTPKPITSLSKRLSQKQASVSRLEFKKVPTSAFKSDLKYLSGLKYLSIPASLSIIKTDILSAQDKKVIQIQQPAQKKAVLYKQDTELIPILKYKQRKVPTIFTPIKPKPTVTRVKVPMIPIIPRPETPKSKKIPYTPGYHAYVKGHRRDIKVTKQPVTKTQAKGMGALITDISVSRSFKIKKTTKPAVSKPQYSTYWDNRSHKFKATKYGWQELPQFAQDTPTERSRQTPEAIIKPFYIGQKKPKTLHKKGKKEFIYLKTPSIKSIKSNKGFKYIKTKEIFK